MNMPCKRLYGIFFFIFFYLWISHCISHSFRFLFCTWICTLMYVGSKKMCVRFSTFSCSVYGIKYILFAFFSNVLIDFLLLRKKISFNFSTFAARLQYQNINKRKSYTDMKMNMHITFHTFAQSYRCFEQNNYVHNTNGIGFSHHQSHSYFHRAF